MATTAKRRRNRPRTGGEGRRRVTEVNGAINDLMARPVNKNGPLGGNRGVTLDWTDYIEFGYDPQEAEWCLSELTRYGVSFALDDDGQFWYDAERLVITPGLRCSIDYRRKELTATLRTLSGVPDKLERTRVIG